MVIQSPLREGRVGRNGVQPTFSSFLASLQRDLNYLLSISPLEKDFFSFHPFSFIAGSYSAKCPVIRATDSEMWATKGWPSLVGVYIPEMFIKLIRPKATPCSRICGWGVFDAGVLSRLPTQKARWPGNHVYATAPTWHRIPTGKT